MKYDITFHPSWWYKHAGIEFTREFFEDPEYRIKCDIKMRKVLYDYFGKYGIGEKDPKERPILGSDLLAAGYFHSALAGCEIVYSKDNSPQVKCMDLSDEDLEDFKIGEYKNHELYKNMVAQVEYLKSKYGYVIPAINLMGIQNIALDIMGQNLFIAYYTEPEAVDRLLGEITDMSIEIGKYLKSLSPNVSTGVTAIVGQTVPDCYLTSNCSVEMISNELYEEFLLKYDNKLSEAFGCFGIHHCGQTMEHLNAGYAKVKNLAFAEVGAGSDFLAVKKALPETVLNARFSPVLLAEGNEETIFEKTKELSSLLGERDSISCVGIDSNVERDKIETFLSFFCEKNMKKE